MNATTLRDLIGLPYRLGAAGPDAVDCWGLVRLACQRVHGVTPPPLATAHDAALQARAQGWRRVRGQPQPGDVLHMRNAAGLLHVGMVVQVRRRLELLHAVAGGSVCQPLHDLPEMGFTAPAAWRLCR